MALIEHIYDISEKSMFKKPTPVNSACRRDKSRYCAFHRQTGHEIADYRQLKDQIEDLIRNGKLRDWVAREAKKQNTNTQGVVYHEVPPPDNNRGDTRDWTVRDGSIHIIMGGPHIKEVAIRP